VDELLDVVRRLLELLLELLLEGELLLVGLEVVVLEEPDWQAVPLWQKPARPALIHLHCMFPKEIEFSNEFKQEILERPLQAPTCTP
jgi:hypothetical protein